MRAARIERDVLRVAGPDAVSFLQGQCSQDISGLAVGASAWSLVLQPQGKIDALVRVTRVDADTVVLDTDGGWGPALLARLNRFKLRVKVELEPLAWGGVALRGPGAAEVAGGISADPAGAETVLVVDAGWDGPSAVDLLGPEPAIPAGIPEMTAGEYEVARIEAGFPAMGSELTERTIPAETGLVERTVSFTKGCYTGQELVARIDSRGGHVPRHLRGVVVVGPAPAKGTGLPQGTVLLAGDKQVGTVTSSAVTADGRTIGLAYVSRNLEPPSEVTAEWDGTTVSASVRTLPLAG